MYSVLPFQIFLAFNLIAVGFNFTYVLLTHLVHRFCSQKHERTNSIKAAKQGFTLKPLLNKCHSVSFRSMIPIISESRASSLAATLLPHKYGELPCLLVHPIVLFAQLLTVIIVHVSSCKNPQITDVLKAEQVSRCFAGKCRKTFQFSQDQ